jgi:predicted transcriptional regulator
VKMNQDFYTESEKKVLELNIRKTIFELVRKHAGCHFRELERKSKLATGTIKYHLNYLVKNQLISEIKENNNIRYFPKGFNSENKRTLSVLRQKSVRNILLYILVHEYCNHEQIAKKVNLSNSTISWHLKKLIKSNIIQSHKEGRKTYFKIKINKQDIINLLITYKESFLDQLVNNIIEMWEID